MKGNIFIECIISLWNSMPQIAVTADSWMTLKGGAGKIRWMILWKALARGRSINDYLSQWPVLPPRSSGHRPLNRVGSPNSQVCFWLRCPPPSTHKHLLLLIRCWPLLLHTFTFVPSSFPNLPPDLSSTLHHHCPTSSSFEGLSLAITLLFYTVPRLPALHDWCGVSGNCISLQMTTKSKLENFNQASRNFQYYIRLCTSGYIQE